MKKIVLAEEDGQKVSEEGEKSRTSGIRSMTIIGQVEGHSILGETVKTTKYEHIIPSLVSLEEDEDAKGLLVILNTAGGDVEAGLAIAEMIASMKKPTVSLVIGGGHSIGVPLAVSARVSFIVPSASMTVHPVRMSGTMIGAPQTYDYLSRVQKRIVRFVASHSQISEARLSELMLVPDELAADMGSVLDGLQAVEEGIIDRVGGLSDALDELRAMIGSDRTANS
ncbi:MAG: ATP-dependent Clp protease proteolytic subunit [Clostridia bacterium]|nr:ATP-dependent Clp protease proteolytic subunit [Clostridia bacterium]